MTANASQGCAVRGMRRAAVPNRMHARRAAAVGARAAVAVRRGCAPPVAPVRVGAPHLAPIRRGARRACDVVAAAGATDAAKAEKLVGVDVGGTFTDVVYTDTASGATLTHKVPTTPENPSKGVLNGILELCDRFGIDKSSITRVLHGTTTATNAILEQDGCKVGMITTEGYRDIVVSLQPPRSALRKSLRPSHARPLTRPPPPSLPPPSPLPPTHTPLPSLPSSTSGVTSVRRTTRSSRRCLGRIAFW